MRNPAAPAGLHLAGTVRRGTFELAAEVEARPGEVLGVLGPNGAGKSTLLRTLAGLWNLSSGRLRLGEHTWDDADGVFVPAERRPVGIVFQDYRLFPHLDVLDNVGFAARSAGAGRRASREQAAGWVDRLGLSPLAHRRPGELSGGQGQRVALARALAREPGLLLLDEPLAALDSRTRIDVRGELRRHLAAFAGPTLLVTHDALDATVLADRLLVLEEGRVVQEGTPGEIAARPATDYVARLVGLNLYAGTLAGDTVEVDGGGSLVVTGTAPPGRVLVALRPSAITLHAGTPDLASHRNVWPGTVTSLELLGDRVRVVVSGRPTALVDITPAAVANLGLRPGSTVWLTSKATETDAYPAGLPL